MSSSPSLSVLVPCRNEARVIERKLMNLCALAWPKEPCELLVVDDGSEDRTAELAAAALGRLALPARVTARVLANDVRPGKPGAIRTGLAAARGELVVLSDADVLLSERALLALRDAFAGDPELALATGRQRFVAELPTDGAASEAVLRALAPRGDLFDLATARVRRLESRLGLLFSVHGQLLAWRRELDLVPAFGVAADDLDLMLQIRDRETPPRAVRSIAGADFYERKIPPPSDGAQQATRRARAYLQAVRGREAPRGGGFLERLQFAFYRHVPPCAPLACSVAAALVIALAGGLLGWRGALVAGLVLVAAASFGPGRQVCALLVTIARANRLEREEPLAERWEMARRG